MKTSPLVKIATWIGRLSGREKMLVYGAAAAVILTLSDQVVIRPIVATFQSLDQQVKDLQGQISRTIQVLSQKDRIAAEIVRYSKYNVPVTSEEEEMLSLLEHIEALASKTTVNLLYVKPAGVKSEGRTKKFYLSLECEGLQPHVVSFFYEVESSMKLLRIEKYAVQPTARGSSAVRGAATISRSLVT